MDLGIAWTVARKDLSVFRIKKSVFYSAALFPLAVAIGLSAVIWYVERKSTIPEAIFTNLLDSFSFFFIIIASAIPVGISSYSIVGEKVEKSLEPLLATPATDEEILLGKSLAAFIPAIIATYIGLAIFMILADALTAGQLGYLYFPNLTVALILLLIDPLAVLLSIGVNILISSRVSDVRIASQLGILPIIPFGGIYVASELGLVTLDTTNLVILSIVLLLLDAALLYLSMSTFQREEILTKWK